MSQIEQILLTALGIGIVGAGVGCAAIWRLFRHIPPPPPVRRTPEQAASEAAAREAEERRVVEATERLAATKAEIEAVRHIEDPDARTRELAALVRRRRGGGR